jgi:altronate dehydratase
MSQKAHVILSFPDENQPPTGFPLIPVISIAGSGALHQAIIGEFDLASSASAAEILDCVIAIANGKKSKSELSNNGEIVAPRSVRSV